MSVTDDQVLQPVAMGFVSREGSSENPMASVDTETVSMKGSPQSTVVNFVAVTALSNFITVSKKGAVRSSELNKRRQRMIVHGSRRTGSASTSKTPLKGGGAFQKGKFSVVIGE
jgi:hypothetical protein